MLNTIEFFKSNKHAGAETFGAYIQNSIEKGVLNTEKLSIGGFIEWMKLESQKNDVLKAKYRPLIASFKEVEKGVYEISGYKTEDYELDRLAKAFYVFRLWGAGVERRYKSALTWKEVKEPPTQAT